MIEKLFHLQKEVEELRARIKGDKILDEREYAEQLLDESGLFNGPSQSPGGFCPVQFTGQLKSGLSVYFRSRGTAATLEIYKNPKHDAEGYEIGWETLGYYEIQKWEFPDAGYLSPIEAAKLIITWLQDWKDRIDG